MQQVEFQFGIGLLKLVRNNFFLVVDESNTATETAEALQTGLLGDLESELPDDSEPDNMLNFHKGEPL